MRALDKAVSGANSSTCMGAHAPDHPPTEPVTLVTLGSGQCHFPIGINADGLHVFCGQPVEHRSYCSEHHAIADHQVPGPVLTMREVIAHRRVLNSPFDGVL